MDGTRAHGRVAVVTGGARGIGYAVARRLVNEGASVVINDIDESACRAAVAELSSDGGRVGYSAGDIGDPAAGPALVEIAVQQFGGLDIVVNNAGITRDSLLHRMSDDDWNSIHRVTLFGAFELLRASALALRGDRLHPPAHNRKVVNISSSVGIYGAVGTANYAAAKAGLIGLTRSLSREWARDRINVNAVAPGLIDGTGLTDAKPSEIISKIAARVPLGRAGTPSDVAAAVAFLASPDSDYMTGQVLEIHGGMEVLV